MRNTSKNSSRITKWIAGGALLAMVVAATVYVAPHLRPRSQNNLFVTNSKRASAPPPVVQQNAVTQPLPSVSVKPASSASAKSHAPVLSTAKQNAPVASAPEALKPPRSKENPVGANERMQADTGSGNPDGETGEDAKRRANYFYYQRAYPFDQTPAGALQQSRQQVDTMIAQQRAAGILPEEGAAVPNSVGFPGPANWTNIGPQPVTNSAGGQNFGNPAATGRVTVIAVDPTTTTAASQVVYLGSATGGVWKSTDGGASWNTIFDQNNSLAIGGIGIAPSAPTTVYVGTGELNFSQDSYYGAGIYKTTDGGTTWTQQCGPSGEFCSPVAPNPFLGGGFMVGDIAVHPTNPNIALAAVKDSGNPALSGIYRTTDGGTTWALIASASAAAGNSIAWNPSDTTIVYATLGERGDATKFGVYKSSDSGVTFTRLTGNGAINNNLPTANLGRHVLAVAPNNGSVVYVSINAESSSSLLGLAKSTDAGVTWTFTPPGAPGTFIPPGPHAVLPNFCSGQCWYDMALAVLPSNSNTLIVGGSAFENGTSTDFRTADGGTTWTDITTGTNAVRPHVDTHVMTFASIGGGNFRLYTGNDGGVWFTDNPTAATVTWQAGNNANLTITQFYPGHAVHPSDENISFGGTQDNGTEKYSGILAWDHVTCGDGAWAAIDPNIPTTVYANCQNIDLLRSSTDGTASSWLFIINEIGLSTDRSLFIPPLVHDPNQSGRLYFGTMRVWQTMNYGNNWKAISPDLTNGANTSDVTSISVAQSNNNVVYATTSDGRVWRTTNASAGTGAAWTNLTNAPLPGRYATMVRTDHSNPDIAYLSYSGFNGFGGDTVGHIFKTIDGGTTWTDISGTAAGALPNTPVNDIAVVHLGTLSFDAVFIATDVGVFECSNPTAATPCQTWIPVGSGLPKVPVVGLAFRENSATLRAVTHGRGVWVIETPGISATGLLLLTSITPSSAALASGSFTMTFSGNDFGVPSGTPQILVDGADVGVSSVNVLSPNQMTATIPASVTAVPGLHQISINQPNHAATPQNPTSGLTFGVPGPAPTMFQISPNQITAGSAPFSLTASGTNYVCGTTAGSSVIQFGINLLPATACTSTSLTVTVPSNLVSTPADILVSVFNPGPGGGISALADFTVNAAAAGPDMTITKSHVGNFTQGQIGATYTITATNSGSAATSAAVNVVDTLPTGLSATALTGTGWTCTLGTLTCTRSDVLGAGSSYPAITLTVTVAGNAAASVTNTATVSGGGETNTGNDVANDSTTINASTAPDLTIAKSHSGNFTQGQVGATYTITAANSGTAATTGTVTVVDTLPTGLTATALSGTGWTCTLGTLTCTRSDALANGSSYPAITLTVTVANNAAASVTNSVTVSGGGETNTANDTATDPTTITQVADMTIAKSHVGNFSQGQTGATYTITASNAGPGPTSGTVTVLDTLPTGLTATAMSGAGWSCTFGTGTCTRSDVLTAASSYPAITLTVNVAINAGASLTNSVTVSGGGEINTANDTATDPTTVTAVSPDMTITKTHVGTFTQGQVGATYTITATNSGGAATTAGATVVDTLPTGLTATALSGTGWTCTLGTLTCTRADVLGAGASYPAITLTVTVANNAAATVTNSVTVSGGGETNTANDTATDPTTVIQVADLTITKTHTGNFSQGQVGATYSITVSNSGPGPTSGTVTVVDTVPTGLTATALTGTGWTCTLGTFTCTRADGLAAGASYPAITLSVTVANNAATSVTNTAVVSGGGELNTANDTANDVTTITQASDLTITKSHIGNFTQGQVGATYTIIASNAGPGPTNGTVTVVDTLPTGLTATAIAGAGWTCTLGTVTCTRADVLAATSSYPAITLTVTVAGNAAASVTNNVAISGGGEINTANDTASDLTGIIPLPDLTIAKSHTGSFTQGQTGATYSITVSNSGFAATSGTVTVVDTLPASLTATAIAGTGWTCTLGTLTCTRADALGAASSYPAISLTVTVANNAAATITNSATVSGGGETNVANDSASDPTTVIQLADLTITKTHTGSFSQGQVGATYTITVSNAGPGPTTGAVNVVDTLPTGLTATAMAGTGWTCTLGTLTCTRSDVLAAAASYPAITLTVTVANNAAASVTNSVTVSGGGELNTANDTANDVTTVTLAPDLTITKTHVGNFTQGQVGATYSITVSNAGPGVTSGTVTVVDTLPAGLTATAETGTGWTCVLGTLTCTRTDALAAAASYPAITLTVTVANNAAASVTNTAVVSGGGEINTANDTANDTTTITQVADLTITKTHTGNFTQGQVGATYTITVTNGGAGATAGTVTVVDTLPAGLTATAEAGTGWTCVLGTLTCTRADVLAAAGSYPAITLTVTVANNAAASLTNTATVSGGGELNVANDVATSPTTITQLADMTITKTHTGSFVLGQTGATYTITATNSGAGPTSGTVTVVDTLPAGLTATAMAGTGWTCTLGTLTCTRSDVLAPATSYPAITLTVTVGTTPGNVTNTATVSGGGEIIVSNDTANDVTALTQDFAETGPGTAVTVTAGQTAMYTITVTPGPGGFSSPITFTASGLPSASTGTFNPTSVTPGTSAATTVFSVATTLRSTFPGAAPPNSSPWKVPQFAWWSFALATLLLSMILFGKTDRRRRLAPAMFVIVALLLAIGITGCSSAASGTPAGTSTITVTATSGAISHSTTVTLTVQ